MSNLDHFTELVCNAKTFGQYASNGEQRCLRIADAILADVGGLDGKAADGLLGFARIAYHNPRLAYELIAPNPLAQQPCNETVAMERMEANMANIPVKPSADELSEIADESAREEMGGRLL